MELFRQWLLGIVACAILIGAAEELAKGSAVFEVLRFTGGLILLLCMLQPVACWNGDTPVHSFAALTKETAELREEYELQHRANAKRSIAERTGAYIEAQAKKTGILLHARVEVEETNETMLPYRVHLDVERSEPLAQWIAQTLAIPRERQHWREEE